MFLTSWRFHNHAWQPQRHDGLPETSGTLWIHRGALTNQRCSLATGCGIIWHSRCGVERTHWTTRIWRFWIMVVVQSIPAIYRLFVDYMRLSVPEHKKSTQQLIKYIAKTKAQFRFNTLVLKLTPANFRQAISRSVPPSPRLNGVERTCWTTGGWQCYLSLNMLRSIPALGIIFSRFLGGL